jgi:hypothetical protein
MRRRLFNLISALSLLLSVAAVVGWARSCWRADEVYVLAEGRGYYLESGHGALMYFSARTQAPRRPRAEWGYLSHADPAARREDMDAIEGRVAARLGNGFRVAGLAFRGGGLFDKDATVLIVPWWLLTLLPAAPAMLWLHRRRRKGQAGTCVHCGYDLRATPSRCPECGTAVALAAHA